jgi:acyl-coenzyme A thioesterase PaaI-like protein
VRPLAQTSGIQADRPFRDAIALTPLGGGRFGAELGTRFTVGAKAHGGLLMVLLARAGLSRVDAEAPGTAPDPLAVAADYLRAPDPGPVELDTEVLKIGRTVSVVAVRMHQGGRPMLAATVTAGRLPDDGARWSDLPEMAAEPAADALDPGAAGAAHGIAGACELRYDTPTFAFVRGERGAPVLRGWVRPFGEPTDVLFALLAGDIMAPTVFNLGGRVGWAPTVQLTALLRARPAPGWLRIESRTTSVTGAWFDEDATVVDETGRLVCQARQLALSPLAS